MIGTGVALWWPRPQNGQRMNLRPDFSLKGRPFWGSLHAALEIWLAAGALAFVLTGMPWTGSWGRYFKSLAASRNLDAPPGAWGGGSARFQGPGMHIQRTLPIQRAGRCLTITRAMIPNLHE